MKKFNIFITILIPVLIIFAITTIFLTKRIISYVANKWSDVNTNSISVTDIDLNEVPYISTYYIEPKVSSKEDVIINYYVTDYYHKEYTEEDTSETFTITVKIDGKKDIVKKKIKAGDNSINIGKFKNPGEQKFSIIATDQYGRNSHELFNFFLVEEKDKEKKEYIMTEADLIKSNIKNIDTYENKYIATLTLEDPNPETVKSELEKIASTITPTSNSYTCIIADTIGNGKPGNWWGETIVKYSDNYDKNAIMQE